MMRLANSVTMSAWAKRSRTTSALAYETSELLAFVLQPTEETWEAAGDREFICSVYLEGEELEGSVEGSER